MESNKILVEFESVKVTELSKNDALLWAEAEKARELSYSPYSTFSVGAALILSNGEIMHAANQENAAFPAGLCAERVLLYAKGAKYPKEEIVSLAVCAGPHGKELVPVTPCGGCRQVMVEFIKRQQNPFRLLFMHKAGEIAIVENAQSLLPFTFEF